MVPVDKSGDEAGDSEHGADGYNESDVVTGADERGQSKTIIKEERIFVSIGGWERIAVFVWLSEADIGIVADEWTFSFGFVKAEAGGVGNWLEIVGGLVNIRSCSEGDDTENYAHNKE